MKSLEILTTITGIVMSMSYYPQAYLILKNKSSKNVSLVSYLIFGVGTLIWTIYGIVIMNWVVILGFALGTVGSWLVIILYFVYRGSEKVENK